jgi:hypothetical protein
VIRFQNFIKGYLMNSVTSLGTRGEFHFDRIMAVISSQEGKTITTDPKIWNLETPGYKEIYERWQAANFNMDSIRWTNYYPKEHFDVMFATEFAKAVNGRLVRAWISRIDPGYMAPWHWDVDEEEAAYLEKGTLTRYSCFMQGATHGHILIVGNDYLYNRDVGELIKWNNYKEWHSGINAGLSPQYIFHIIVCN